MKPTVLPHCCAIRSWMAFWSWPGTNLFSLRTAWPQPHGHVGPVFNPLSLMMAPSGRRALQIETSPERRPGHVAHHLKFTCYLTSPKPVCDPVTRSQDHSHPG